jgi:hypothetical protein
MPQKQTELQGSVVWAIVFIRVRPGTRKRFDNVERGKNPPGEDADVLLLLLTALAAADPDGHLVVRRGGL